MNLRFNRDRILKHGNVCVVQQLVSKWNRLWDIGGISYRQLWSTRGNTSGPHLGQPVLFTYRISDFGWVTSLLKPPFLLCNEKHNLKEVLGREHIKLLAPCLTHSVQTLAMSWGVGCRTQGPQRPQECGSEAQELKISMLISAPLPFCPQAVKVANQAPFSAMGNLLSLRR